MITQSRVCIESNCLQFVCKSFEDKRVRSSMSNWSWLLSQSNSTSASLWRCKLKLDKEKWKHAGFGPATLHTLLRLVKSQQSLTPAKEEKSVINMICLLLPVSDSPIVMFGPGGLLLVPNLLPICSLSFSFMDGVRKR